MINNNQIQPILASLGLDQLEISCYLDLLKKSPQRASELAKKFDAPKATVLVALYRLSDHFGIIKRTKQKNCFLFWVEDVNDLLNYTSRQEQQSAENKKTIEQLLPGLRAIMSLDAVKPQISYYEGKKGLKKAFEQVLEEADEIIGYGSNEDDIKYLPELYPNYYERRVKRKIPVKAIIPATDFNIKALANTTKELRDTHLIAKGFNYPIQVNIYKHTAVFYSFEESFALIIKSRPIADCLKMVFGLAFEKAGESDKPPELRTPPAYRLTGLG
jgi:sugar-specific transcriptional regulator TrmB